MKRWALACIACVLLISSCQVLHKESRVGLEGFDPAVVRQPQPLLPNVFITDSGLIVVDQEPIRIGKRDVRDGRVTISWALAAGSPYTFPSTRPPYKDSVDGIVIGPGSDKPQDKPVEATCVVQGSRKKVIECSFRAPREGRTRYKYTVNVLQGSRLIEALDPNIEGSY